MEHIPGYQPVASLGLVSPGAENEGVIPIFSEKLTTLFSHYHLSVCLSVLQCHPYLFSPETDDLFSSSLSLLFISLGCYPLDGVTPHLFHLSDLVCPLFFVNSPTKKFFVRVSPPGGCHPGRSPLVTSLLSTRTKRHCSYNTLLITTSLPDQNSQ